MGTIEKFSTPRLQAERFDENHFAYLRHLQEDARVMQYVGGVRSFEETEESSNFYVKQWKDFGCGIWLLHDAKTSEFVGMSGFRNELLQGKSELVLLSLLVPKFWGQGLTTEISKELLNIATQQLHKETVFSFAALLHTAPQKILEKLGFQHEYQVDHQNSTYAIYRWTQGSVQ